MDGVYVEAGLVLRDLKNRGMNCLRLVVGDGHLIFGVYTQVLRNNGAGTIDRQCVG